MQWDVKYQIHVCLQKVRIEHQSTMHITNNYKSIFLHRLTFFLRPIVLTATATECVDKKSAKKCNKAKRKGKCHKSWAQRDCQLTCGVCTSSAKDAVAGANSKQLLKIEF